MKLFSIKLSAHKLWPACFLALLISLPSFGQKRISLTNGEWPPYLSERLNQNGFASAVVREAFRAVDVQVEYGYFPWKRAFHYAKVGKSPKGKIWHGSVVWFYSPERAKDFIYSDPVLIEDGVLYHLKTRPIHWQTVEDLRGRVIGGTAHTLYPLFEEAQEKGILTIERAGNYDVLFDRLLGRRIDAVPQVIRVADYFLHTRYPPEIRDKITYSPTVFDKRIYHLILNRRHPDNSELLKLFNKGLKMIKNNGVYNQLVEQLNDGYFYK